MTRSPFSTPRDARPPAKRATSSRATHAVAVDVRLASVASPSPRSRPADHRGRRPRVPIQRVERGVQLAVGKPAVQRRGLLSSSARVGIVDQSIAPRRRRAMNSIHATRCCAGTRNGRRPSDLLRYRQHLGGGIRHYRPAIPSACDCAAAADPRGDHGLIDPWSGISTIGGECGRHLGSADQTVGFQHRLPANYGLMFWLPSKRLSGSYLRLMSTSRS